MADTEKLKALKLAMDKMDKDFGKGTIIGAKDKPLQDIEVVSTGSIGLDNALGVGGTPRGRIMEIYGPESSGKTTIASGIVAEAHRANPDCRCAYIDTEHSYELHYAERLGVDLDRLLISQPDNGEQALEVADRLIQTGAMDVIVIDSVAALVPKSELEGEMGETKMGAIARLMSQACRKMTGNIAKTGTIVIFINQLREKIAVMHGSPETTTGGNALKFYASIRLDVRRIAGNKEKDGTEIISNRTKVTVKKNKVAPPFKHCEFNMLFGEGIDKYMEVVEMASDLGIINKSGSWYAYNNDKLGQGAAGVVTLLRDNEELYQEIRKKTREQLQLKP